MNGPKLIQLPEDTRKDRDMYTIGDRRVSYPKGADEFTLQALYDCAAQAGDFWQVETAEVQIARFGAFGLDTMDDRTVIAIEWINRYGFGLKRDIAGGGRDLAAVLSDSVDIALQMVARGHNVRILQDTNGGL